MKKVSAKSEKLLGSPNSQNLNLKLIFKPIRKLFHRFSKIKKFYFFRTNYEKIFSKIRETFSGGHSLMTTLRVVVQVRGVAVGRTRLMCTRLQHRTCKTSRGHFASLVVSKKVPAIYGDFDFFCQKISDFENWSWIFFHLKKFLKFFGKLYWMTFL